MTKGNGLRITSIILVIIGLFFLFGAHIAFIVAATELLPVGHSALMIFAGILILIGYILAFIQ